MTLLLLDAGALIAVSLLGSGMPVDLLEGAGVRHGRTERLQQIRSLYRFSAATGPI